MTTARIARSIYLDEEIAIIRNAKLSSGINLHETDMINRKRGRGVGHCGKVILRDSEEAKQVLFIIRSKRNSQAAIGVTSKRQETRYYFCNRCHGFHITSKADIFEVAVEYVNAA